MGLGESEVPKFTVIVAQKRHHTRLFEAGGSGNVPPGMMCFCLLKSRESFVFPLVLEEVRASCVGP